MANQLTDRNESLAAAAARNAALAIAASAGSQFLAHTATAQIDAGSEEQTTPILYPEVVVAFVVGVVVGAVGAGVYGNRKKKKDES